ncbi:MAG: hypothetical protein ACYC4T_13085 [Melioribacteraceae bacterium]
MDFQNNSRFKTLLSLGKTISIIGWVIVGFAGLTIFSSLTSCVSNDSFAKAIGLLSFPIGLLTGAFGYLFVAMGQMISCFVSMEDNTHKTAELLNELKSQLPNFNTK